MANKKNAEHFTPGGAEFQSRLDTLFQVDGPEADRESVLIDRGLIDPDPNQPRQYFPRAKLEELAHSLRSVGQLQPMLLRPHPTKEGRYMIVVGERRWRASDEAFDADLGPMPKLKANVRKLTDFEVTRIQIDENDKREDVSPVAVARGYQRLYDMLFSQESGKNVKRWKRVAEEVGVAERTVFRFVKLLSLPPEMQTAIEEKELSANHGAALTDLEKWPNIQKALFRQILKGEISGNQAMRLSKEMKPIDVKMNSNGRIDLGAPDTEDSPQASQSPSPSFPRTRGSSDVNNAGSAEISTSEFPLVKGDKGGFKTPTPATQGTGMPTASEPEIFTPVSLAGRRNVFMQDVLLPAFELIEQAVTELHNLTGEAKFEKHVGITIEEIEKELKAIKRELRK